MKHYNHTHYNHKQVTKIWHRVPVPADWLGRQLVDIRTELYSIESDGRFYLTNSSVYFGKSIYFENEEDVVLFTLRFS